MEGVIKRCHYGKAHKFCVGYYTIPTIPKKSDTFQGPYRLKNLGIHALPMYDA